MNERKLKKVEKALGLETLKVFESLGEQELKQRIVQAEQAKEQVEAELEANPKLQEIKEALKDLTASKREVNSRQNAIISLCVHLLEKLGG